MNKLLTSLALTAATTVGTLGMTGVFNPNAAQASGNSQTYYYNKSIGKVYFKSATVYKKSNGGTAIKATFTLPTCGSRYYLSGYVQTSFYAKDGGYMKNYTLYTANRYRNNEGQTLTRYASSNYRMSPVGGRSYMHVNLTCQPLAPLRTNIKKPNTDWLKKYDPTEGVFW